MTEQDRQDIVNILKKLTEFAEGVQASIVSITYASNATATIPALVSTVENTVELLKVIIECDEGE